MSNWERRLILGAGFWPTGMTPSGWRSSRAFNQGIFKPDLLVDWIRTAERGVFDYFFMGNTEWSAYQNHRVPLRRVVQPNGFAVASYLAAHSNHIGLITSISTSYYHPYLTAYIATTIDHLSQGRYGLNLVASRENDGGYRNYFGIDQQQSRPDKYRRAAEFADIFNQLQDSWEDGWYLDDKAGGVLFDPGSAHTIDYVGDYFQVQGPLNAPRPPQGRIPLVHAGSSEESFEFGAKYADLRFINSDVIDEGAVSFANGLKARAAKYGRTSHQHLLVNGVNFYAAATDTEARDIFREVEALVVDEFSSRELAAALKVDERVVRAQSRLLDVLDLDDPELNANAKVIVNRAITAHEDDGITFLDLFRFLLNHQSGAVVVGGPKKIADWLEYGFNTGAFDGVKVFTPFVRAPFYNFVDFVIPELQRRNLSRRSYDTSTLRGHLGLDRPKNIFETGRYTN